MLMGILFNGVNAQRLMFYKNHGPFSYNHFHVSIIPILLNTREWGGGDSENLHFRDRKDLGDLENLIVVLGKGWTWAF